MLYRSPRSLVVVGLLGLWLTGSAIADAALPAKWTNTPTLNLVCRDLTELAAAGKLSPLVGRESDMRKLLEILGKLRKPNAMITGDAGVGKTALVEGLAALMAADSDRVPASLRNRRLIEVNLTSLVSGTKYRGELEQRAQSLITELTAHSKEVVVFIDEVHTILGAGATADGDPTVGEIMKKFLASGEVPIIAATTKDEYRAHIEKDSGFKRRFNKDLELKEPTHAETLEIVRRLGPSLERHHSVRFDPGTFEAAVELGSKYLREQYNPDKTLDLLDTAASGVAQSEKARRDRQKAAKRGAGARPQRVRPGHIARLVTEQTGIPVATGQNDADLLQLEPELRARVIGQDHAVKDVVNALQRAKAKLAPTSSFLMVGPTGTGKTELARALAATLFGDPKAFIQLDMGEFQEEHSTARLIGAPPGYRGYDEGGQLTEAVRRRPYSVVLFDEIEKANPSVVKLLLGPMGEDRRLTDGKGRTVDFSNTLILMTSNATTEALRAELRAPLGFVPGAEPSAPQKSSAAPSVLGKDALLKTLRSRGFPDEVLNRMRVVQFAQLSPEAMAAIVDLKLATKQEQLLREHGATLEVTPAARALLAIQGKDPVFGARPLQRLIEDTIDDQLMGPILEAGAKKRPLAGTRFTFDVNQERGKIVCAVGVAKRVQRVAAASPGQSQRRAPSKLPSPERVLSKRPAPEDRPQPPPRSAPDPAQSPHPAPVRLLLPGGAPPPPLLGAPQHQ